MLPDSVAEYLGSAVQGLAYSESDDSGNVYVDRMPSQPDRAVAVYSSGGPEADSRLPYDPAEFQVIVRGEADARWARSTWGLIYATLHGLRNVTLPGGVYVAYVLATQASPFPLGDDENGRPQFSCDFRTEILNPTKERP